MYVNESELKQMKHAVEVYSCQDVVQGSRIESEVSSHVACSERHPRLESVLNWSATAACK